MPAPVDHDCRRRQVAETASRLITEYGLDSVTFREIAATLGYSTSVVSHYFRNKRELLLYVYDVAAQNGVDRINSAMETGLTPIQCLETILPVDRQRQQDWHVILAFWGKAASDTSFRKEQRKRGQEMLGLVRKLVPGTSDTAAEAKARIVLTVVIGLATQVVFDESAWSAKQQRAVLNQIIDT